MKKEIKLPTEVQPTEEPKTEEPAAEPKPEQPENKGIFSNMDL